MGRAFSFSDAKKLSKLHIKRLTDLNKAYKSSIIYESDLPSIAATIKDSKLKDLLSKVPVEELGKDKTGLRIGLLKDHGIENVWEVYALDKKSLVAISGIGEKTAQVLKEEAKRLAVTARDTIKISLSLDDIDKDQARLLLAAYRIKESKEYKDVTFNMIKTYKSNIDELLEALKPATNPLKWLVSSTEKKDNSTIAFDKLTGLILGQYGQDSDFIIKHYEKLAKFSSADAIADFKKDPVSYATILEEYGTEPGKAKTALRYGMSDEVAQAVDGQELNLAGLKCTLRRYQEWGVKYIIHQKRALLGDEMGLGKTVQAIAAMIHLRNAGRKHFLVVCPASVLTNWYREILKMSDLKPIKIHGNNKDEKLRRWMEEGGVGITTYEATGGFDKLSYFKYDMLVVDEAHYIKNPSAQRTKHVKALCDTCDNILFMTGTALENSVDEMIELVKVLDPVIAARIKNMAFMSTANAFKEAISPVYFRRKREDVLHELPELIEQKEWVELMPEEEMLYQNALFTGDYTGVRRVSYTVQDVHNSSKIRRMCEIINQAALEGRKCIVFSFYLDTIYLVSQVLGDVGFGPITGALSSEERQRVVDEFTNAPEGAVLVAQIQSGGVGLNIQAASVVIFCEPQFKPSTENQALSRAYRMGQTRNVLVFRLLADDTVDERIIEMLDEKQTVFDTFADTSAIEEQSREIDATTFDRIVKEEIERIKNKKK